MGVYRKKQEKIYQFHTIKDTQSFVRAKLKGIAISFFSFREPAARKYPVKKAFLKTDQISQEDICVGVSFVIKFQVTYLSLNLIKKTDTQVFSCEICKIFKNIIFTELIRFLLLVLLVNRSFWSFQSTVPAFQFLEQLLHSTGNCQRRGRDLHKYLKWRASLQ